MLKEIRALYRKAGKEPPAVIASTVYNNRGVLQAALAVEAIRNALQAKPGAAITGDDVKKGFEHIKDFTPGGLYRRSPSRPKTTRAAAGSKSGIKGGKLVRVTDWFKAYPDVIAHHLKASHAR